MTTPRQPTLFGDDIPQQDAGPAAAMAGKIAGAGVRRVAAAPPAPETIATAASLPRGVFLGTSSWSFPGWNGIVYDGEFRETRLAREGLAAYAQHPLLATVGIDRTFYGPLSEQEFAHYAAQVPEHFRFLVKAPMAVTSPYQRLDDGSFADSDHFLDAAFAIDTFIEPCLAGLAQKAGPLVFQFPPQGTAIMRRPDPFINGLYRFLTALPALPDGACYAVEVRDPQLLTERFFKCLHLTGARFCIASHARMPSPGEQHRLAGAVNSPGPLVVRWSLHAGFKYADAKSRYFPFNRLVDEDPDTRESLARACVETLEKGYPVYVVVNNKAEGSAPLSIGRLAQRIGELSLKSPPPSPKLIVMIKEVTRPFAKAWRKVRNIASPPVAPIDEQLWQRATAPYQFVRRLSAEENRRLRLIASDFLARKRIEGAADLQITDLMRVQIAAQACILVLELGVESFDGWRDIVVYPGKFVPEREVVDDAGVVHTTRDPLAGEAWLGGPVVLSYEDIARTGDPVHGVEGYNVVIHEFAHKLDMLNGEANGFPPLHKGMSRDAWQQAFMAAYLAFCRQVDAADAQSYRDGGRALAALPLDPYASENPAEFFAVISEAFFELPEIVESEYPDIYAQLRAYYRQDPAALDARG